MQTLRSVFCSLFTLIFFPISFEAIDVKMIFYSLVNKTHFHKKGFALRLVLKGRIFGFRKWPIAFSHEPEFPVSQPFCSRSF